MNEHMKRIVQYLEQTAEQIAETITGHSAGRDGYAYTCVMDYVFQRGHEAEAGELTEEQQDVVSEAIERAVKGKDELTAKHCFHNAQRVAMADESGRLRYVEGYAMSVIPMHHAWIEIDGIAVEVTWSKLGPAYYGVAFDRDAVKQFQLTATVDCVSMIDDWPNGWPLLQGEDDGSRKDERLHIGSDEGSTRDA